MPNTMADLIDGLYDELDGGKKQEAAVNTLIVALRKSGPVLRDAVVAQISADDEGVVDISCERALREFAESPRDGLMYYDDSKIPDDEVLSAAWGIPLAKDFVLS